MNFWDAVMGAIGIVTVVFVVVGLAFSVYLGIRIIGTYTEEGE